MATYWIQFQTNPADRDAREQERRVLLDLAANERERPELLVEVLRPWAREYAVLDANSARLRDELLDELVRLLAPRVVDQFLSLLSAKGGIARLYEKNRHMALKYLLFSRVSPLWNESYQARLFSIVESASTDGSVQENCWKLLDFIVEASLNGIDVCDTSEAKEALTRANLSSKLWQSATARQIQYRMQKHLIDARESLIQLGVSPDLLPIPDWLAPRMAELDTEKQKASQ